MKLLDHFGREIPDPQPELRQVNLNEHLQWLTNEPTHSYISPYGALGLSTVYACIKLLADSIAMTPLKLYEKRPRARERTEVTRGPFAEIAREACPLFNNFTFWQSMITSLNGWGNAYAVIIRRDGIPDCLLYVPAEDVHIFDSFDPRFRFLRGEVPYVYQVSTGMETMFVRPNDMVHVIAISRNGIEGLSPIQLHQDTMQVENEQTKYGRSFYSTGGKITGVIESPQKTSKEDATEFVTWFNQFYGGNPSQAGSGRIAFLPNGLIFKQAAVVNPQDAEWVNARRLTRQEIASIYRVPPYLLGDLERATWSSITQLSEEFVRYTLNPLYTAIEVELNKKLLDGSQTLFYEFDPSVLLRGTVSERYTNYSTAINSGFLSPAEAREKEGLPFREELDYFLMMPGSEAVGDAPDENEEDEDMNVRMATEVASLITDMQSLKAQMGQRNFDLELSVEKLKLELEASKAEVRRLEEQMKSYQVTLQTVSEAARGLDIGGGTIKSIKEDIELCFEEIQSSQSRINALEEAPNEE